MISAGLSSIVSIGCAIAGIVCSRNGKRKVDAGETPKHRGLAQAGFIIGWVGLGLSILATVALDRSSIVVGAIDGRREHDPLSAPTPWRDASGADAILARPWRIPTSSSI